MSYLTPQFQSSVRGLGYEESLRVGGWVLGTPTDTWDDGSL